MASRFLWWAADFLASRHMRWPRSANWLQHNHPMPESKSTDRAIGIGDGARIIFAYRNWRGEQSQRYVETYRVYWGVSEWHPEPQWLLSGFDLNKREHRQFALKDMSNFHSA